MALVEWSDNVKISDQVPATYWPAQVIDKQKDAGLTPERLANQMRWHALPQDWQELGYQEFLPSAANLWRSSCRTPSRSSLISSTSRPTRRPARSTRPTNRRPTRARASPSVT
ncbi:MAG: hypothetical protein F2840_14825 [Actinobacteria bacterium]|uniref:Unannotated protein n=1 Tax=freshwater metagenome TaxID=449393 RepID=A0A6J7LHF0_9ZZZZ|nr:hypothetical protein [Actinomycetota bacterium]